MKTNHGYTSLRDKAQIPFDGYVVAQWCANDEGVNPTEVHLYFIYDSMPGVMPVMRFKSMRAVNELIEVLQEHAKEVFNKETEEEK